MCCSMKNVWIVHTARSLFSRWVGGWVWVGRWGGGLGGGYGSVVWGGTNGCVWVGEWVGGWMALGICSCRSVCAGRWVGGCSVYLYY